MRYRLPYTKVEVIEELPENQPSSKPLVRTNTVLINGQAVTVAKDGIWIDYDHGNDVEREPITGGVVSVTVELLVDEFTIKQVPPGYAE